jgi:Zn-dependent peptidase ImmA (M78 family)
MVNSDLIQDAIDVAEFVKTYFKPQYGFVDNNTVRICLNDLCNQCALPIRYSDGWAPGLELDQWKFVIYLRKTSSQITDNFYIGMALGRFFLQTKCGADKREYYSDWRNQEIQARRFAAELLLPIPLFVEKYKEFNGSLGWLSAFFQIATPPIEQRAKYTIGIL